MDAQNQAFIKKLKHPIKFRMYLLAHLPSALFAGLRITKIDEQSCEVSIPYKWLTKNPFRSTYFACLSMAAELSTGALCLLHQHAQGPSVSMLVTKVESEYFKKATGRTYFSCEDGFNIRDTIKEAIGTNESKIARAKSVGRNSEGIVVAEFYITWSFKARK